MDITQQPAWTKLQRLFEAKKDITLRELFAADATRASTLTFDAAGLHVDLSKNLIDAEVHSALVELAQQAGVEERRADMFAGKHINTTEDRAVLHTALRIPVEDDLVVDEQDVAADVHEVLGRMRDFATALRSGNWLGHTATPSRKWSTLVLAVPTWARQWRHKHYAAMKSRASPRTSSPMWILRTWQRPLMVWMPVQRCSSFFEDFHHPGDFVQCPCGTPLAAGAVRW